MKEMIDLTEDAAGRASAFAVACAGTWVFVRNMVMKPAIKSCHQRIEDLEKVVDDYREQRAFDRARISQLETVLLTSGNQKLAGAMQRALSETRVVIDKMEGKI